jgi:hypothetical protein
MNQTLISNIVSDIALSDPKPSFLDEAPEGFTWQKDPDEYDAVNDLLWEGGWSLQPLRQDHHCFGKFDGTKCTCGVKKIPEKLEKPRVPCEWKCPNGHMEDHYCYKSEGGYDKWLVQYKKEKIERERKAISNIFNPDYHVCTHKCHESCTNSICCDVFWHDGECDFVSDVDGKEEGFAVRYGDQ